MEHENLVIHIPVNMIITVSRALRNPNYNLDTSVHVNTLALHLCVSLHALYPGYDQVVRGVLE